MISLSGELSLNDVFSHKLSPYPPALFQSKNILLKPDKSQLLHAIKDYTTTSEAERTKSIPETDHYVLDGGSLLHRLKWTEGSLYTSIAGSYASFTINKYGKATIVFDGYNGEPSTKDNAHERRKNHVSNKVQITDATKFTGKKEDFLSNNENKHAIIKLIGNQMQERGCHVIHAEGDADVEIVKAAVAMSSYRSTTVIGEDTDLLVLLLFHSKTDCMDLYFRSDKTNDKELFVYDIKLLKNLFGKDACSDILFGHAFSGCNTTSRIFGVGKKSVFQKVISEDNVFRSFAKTFCTPSMDPEIIDQEGCKAMVTLFNGKEGESLESLRSRLLSKRFVQQRALLNPKGSHQQHLLQNFTLGEHIFN